MADLGAAPRACRHERPASTPRRRDGRPARAGRRRCSRAASTARSGPSGRSAASRCILAARRGRRGSGTRTGRRYLDFVGVAGARRSWGTPIRPSSTAVARRGRRRLRAGRDHPLEVELGEAIRDRDAVDRAAAVHLVGHRGGDERRPPGARRHRPGRSSSSSRARYHGHADGLLAEAGSGRRDAGHPGQRGRDRGSAAADDHRAAVQRPAAAVDAGLRRSTPAAIAAVVVEPVVANVGRHRARGRASCEHLRELDPRRTARCSSSTRSSRASASARAARRRGSASGRT